MSILAPYVAILAALFFAAPLPFLALVALLAVFA